MNEISERIEQIRERTEAATEGPWHQRPSTMAGKVWVRRSGTFLGGDDVKPIFEVRDSDERPSAIHEQAPQKEKDAAFIASARSDVPFLLSLVEDVGEALAAMGLSKSEHWIAVFESRSGAHWTADQLRALRDAALEADD